MSLCRRASRKILSRPEQLCTIGQSSERFHMGERRMGRPMNLEGATQRINLGHAQAAIQRCALATLARLKCSSGLLAAALLAAAMIRSEEHTSELQSR